MEQLKYYIKECLFFQGDATQKALGVFGWMGIISIILNLIVLFK